MHWPGFSPNLGGYAISGCMRDPFCIRMRARKLRFFNPLHDPDGLSEVLI